MRFQCWTGILILSFVALAAGCSSSDGGVFGSDPQLRVMLTSTPSISIESVVVSVSRVVLVAGTGGSSASAQIELLAGAPRTIDLLSLAGGAQSLLADGVIPEGAHGELRLVIDSATVTLAEGLSLPDGSRTVQLHVPGHMSDGVEVQLSGPIVASGGSVTTVVVDFDVALNFILVSGAGVETVNFKPLLSEHSRTQQ